MERADFHGHPVLYPSYDPEFGLERYVRICIERGITIPPTTSFGEEDRFRPFYEDIVPVTWVKERFERGFVVFDESGKRTIFFRSQEVPTKEGHLLLVGLDKNVKIGMSLE